MSKAALVASDQYGSKQFIYVQEDDSERHNAHFKVGNKPSIKLDEFDKLCNVVDQFRGRPRVDEVVFGHGWSIAINAYINADKFKMFDKDVQFLQTEGLILRLADAELTLHIVESHDESLGPVFKSSLMIKLRERARSCHVPFKSWMKAMKVDGPLTDPNGIPL